MSEVNNVSKKLRNLWIYLCTTLLLVGCGKESLPEATQEPQAEVFDWKSEGFALSGEILEEQGLWVGEYLEWEHSETVANQESEYLYVCEAGSLEGKVYRFLQKRMPTEDTEETREENQYYMEIYDTATKSAQLTEVDMEALGFGGAFLRGAQVLDADGDSPVGEDAQKGEQTKSGTADGSEIFALQVWQVREAGEAACQIFYTDLLQVKSCMNIGEVYERYDIAEDICAFECIVDENGNIYARAGSSWQPFRDLYIFDQEGNLLLKHSGGEEDEIREPLRMPTGELVFPIYNIAERTTEFVWFNLETRKEVTLARLDKEIVKQVYGISGNTIYYEAAKGLMCWNIATGERQLVYNYSENGVSAKHQTGMILVQGQSPVLRTYGTVEGEQEDWLLVLSETEVAKADAIKVVALTTGGEKVQACAATASRKNPQFTYAYQDGSKGDAEAFRTRIIAEMVSGEGPDILYVSTEDMAILQEKGLLMDLEQLLGPESLEQVLPGVIQMGTVENTFVGLAPEISLLTMVTLKDIWQQDTWSMQDITGLMESGDFTGLFCQGDGVFAPQAVLKFLVEFGLQDGSLIDWEKGESLFEGKTFLQMLEMTKKYGGNPVTDKTYLGIGGCPAMFTGGGVYTLNELYEQYGDTYYFVGQPTTGSSGNYLTCNGVVVVNKNTRNPEAVAVFLECLLKDEIQYASSMRGTISVKRVSAEEAKLVETEGKLRASWRGWELCIKEDGSTILEDYATLLESLVPYPGTYDAIISIVWEEASAYVDGDKSAEAVAKIVDSRIQLYLDERSGD